MNQSLSEAMHDIARDVPPLGDLDAAFGEVRARRLRLASVLGAVVVVVTAGVSAFTLWRPMAIGPAAPGVTGPTGEAAAVQVLDPRAALPIEGAPLPGGADVAATIDGVALAWGDGQARVLWPDGAGARNVLSRDGRLVATYGTATAATGAAAGVEGSERLVITDVTTGRRWQLAESAVGDTPTEVVRVLWSGDASRLFVVTVPTDGAAEPAARLHVYVPAGQGSERWVVRDPSGFTVGDGVLVGANEDGSEALVTQAGELAILVVDTGELIGTGDALPAAALDHGRALGDQCWQPDEARVCWIRQADRAAGSPSEVGWINLGTGQWTWRRGNLVGALELAGWRDGDPMVVEALTPQTARLVRMTVQGPVLADEFAIDATGGAALVQPDVRITP
jgi:hypothetical protein